jgi:anti-sigma factor (TIGR02949 family)
MTANCGEDCEEALRQLEEYLDRELPPPTVEQIAIHLEACYPCKDRADFEEHLRDLVRRDCIEHAPDTLVLKIRHRLDGIVSEA